jgi:hypothetical protein
MLPVRPSSSPCVGVFERLAQALPELLPLVISFLGPALAMRLAATSSKLNAAYRSAPWQRLVFVDPGPPRPSKEQILGLVRSAVHSVKDLRLRLVTAGARCWDGAELAELLHGKASSLQRIELTHAYGISDETVCLLAACESLQSVVLQCSGTHRLSERALRALLAQPSLRELRVMAPGVRLSDEGMAALFTEARRGTLTHAHIGSDAPANALLTRGEVALALEWASPAVCAHLAACPCLERVTIDTDLPSLRELLAGAPLLPLLALEVRLWCPSTQILADCLRAFTPPPATLVSLVIRLHGEPTGGGGGDGDGHDGRRTLRSLVQSMLHQAKQAAPLVTGASEAEAEGAQPLHLMLHLPRHLVRWSTADLELPGVNVQMGPISSCPSRTCLSSMPMLLILPYS